MPDLTPLRKAFSAGFGRALGVRASCIAAALVLALAGCAAPAPPAPPAPGSAAGVAAPQRIADGVYLVPGSGGEVGPDNLGRVGNAGFIVGPDGVVAIETGTSYRHGLALLAAIRSVTDRPVRLALITHTRQEFLFGATAFRERGIPVAMHVQAAGLMRSRCERCLKTLQQTLGDDAMQGTRMFTPDREFDGAQALDLIGRPLRLLYYGHSSGPGDVALLDVRSGVLFAGGLLDAQRIPDVQDADLDGWGKALQALRQLPLTAIVPGHGAAAGPGLVDVNLHYLTQLQARVLALLRDGAALSEVPDGAALPEFASWDLYDTIHRRNASVLFVRLERAQMVRQLSDRKE